MTQSTLQTRQSESGFTLVELAIVMIIIGLLIGGILKGQELINNARVSSSVSQIKGMEAAINTFKDKYAALPGDVTNVATRLPGCTAAICNVSGNGNSQIDAGDLGAAPATPVAGTNETQVFAHLAAANLLTGNVQPNQAWAVATALPEFNLGGKMYVGYVTGAQTGAIAAPPAGHYVAIGSGGGALSASILRVVDVANIDRKLDDGLPNTGSVMAAGAAACAANTPTSLYLESGSSTLCGAFIRILN